jgi:hypothetical protein
MKKIAANLVLLVTFVFLLTAAGYSQQLVLKADVPFEFTVGKKTFPAGEYHVVRTAPHTLSLRDSNGGVLMSVVTEPVLSLISRSNPRLKFETVGGQYILTEVWPEGAHTGYELLAQKRPNVIAQTPSAPEGQTSTSTYTGK